MWPHQQEMMDQHHLPHTPLTNDKTQDTELLPSPCMGTTPYSKHLTKHQCKRTWTLLQMMVEYLCANLFLLICCSNVTRCTGRAFHQCLEPSCRESLPFSGENIREVGRWCWPIWPGSLSALLLNPKGLCSLQSCSKCRLWWCCDVETGNGLP